MVSKFAFKFNLYRYATDPVTGAVSTRSQRSGMALAGGLEPLLGTTPEDSQLLQQEQEDEVGGPCTR
jgi:hypothetical protein